MTRTCWLNRVVRDQHGHAVELTSRRWRGGHDSAVAEMRRDNLISTQVFGRRWHAYEAALRRRQQLLVVGERLRLQALAVLTRSRDLFAAGRVRGGRRVELRAVVFRISAARARAAN